MMKFILLIFIPLTATTLDNGLHHGEFHRLDGAKLKCVHCEIEVLDSGTFSYDYSRELEIRSSKVHTIKPNAFENLVYLEHISLANNEITNIYKDAFVDLYTLHELDLGFNKLNNLTRGFLNGINVTIVRLNDNQLVEIPDEVFKGLSGTMIFDFSYNSISTLYPNSLNYLYGLENLYLQGNKLNSLPIDVFKHVRGLKTLNLAHNKFTSFSFSLFSPLRDLTHLNISHNNLDGFKPSIMLPLWKIKLLDISDIGLTELHEMSITMFMPTLQWLVINDNIWECQQLVDIIQYLKYNKIDVTDYTSHRYDITNINGVACYQSPHDGKVKFQQYLDEIKRNMSFAIMVQY